MAITEKQRSAFKLVSLVLVLAIIWLSVFSVSAQTISDENSTNTETEISEEFIFPNGDKIIIADDASMELVKGVTVQIKVGTNAYKDYDVPQGTVNDALEHANITLGQDDTVNHSLEKQVEDDTKIKVNRVKYTSKTKTEKYSFKTVKKKTNKLYVGETKVIKKGKNGKKAVTYTTKYVNGKAKKTIVSKTEITKKAVNKVVQVGTKKKDYITFGNNPTSFKTKSSGGAGTFVDCNGKTVAYTKKVTGSGTAYTASPSALTSVGDYVHIGGVAVNPNIIPYGSKLYIETTDGTVVYGYAVANDTGGFATAGTAVVDLFYPSYDACIQFGRRNVNIYVLA